MWAGGTGRTCLLPAVFCLLPAPCLQFRSPPSARALQRLFPIACLALASGKLCQSLIPQPRSFAATHTCSRMLPIEQNPQLHVVCCGSTEGAESSMKGAQSKSLSTEKPSGSVGSLETPKCTEQLLRFPRGQEGDPSRVTLLSDPLCAPAAGTHPGPKCPCFGTGFVQAHGKSLQQICFPPTNPSSVGCTSASAPWLTGSPPLFYSGV